MESENKYQKSIDLLNRALQIEISTSLQYMYFHVHCEDMGYVALASLFKRTAIQEMEHIEDFAERILFLQGDVIMHSDFEVKQVRELKGMLELAMRLEETTVDNYNRWAKESAAMADSMTKRMFEDTLGEEETHLDNFRTELDNLRMYGDQYLALQSAKNSKRLAKELVLEDDEFK